MKKFALSLSVVVLAGSLQLASAGDITGKVTLKGTPPPPITIAYDDTCSKLQPTVLTTRHYVVGKDDGLANVFVYISKGLEGKTFPPSTAMAEIDQVGCNYNPYVFGVMVGQPVRIKNSDPLMHNIHALPKVDGNSEFNFAEPSQGDVNDTKWVESIKKPEVMVKIKCDVHQWMFAYAGVQDNPFFAVSDADGNFKIANVPPGSYTLTAYHLKAHGSNPGVSQQIAVADSPVTANFTVEVRPRNSSVARIHPNTARRYRLVVFDIAIVVRRLSLNVSLAQTKHDWLKRYAIFTALATFVLVCVGGLVTSHEAGMAVPDWPYTCGYNMFFFPISKWIGGVFFEHTHRLTASLVGLLTTVLALWLYGYKARPLLRWTGGIFMAAGAGLCFVFPAHSGENLLLCAIGLAGWVAGFYWPKRQPAPKWLRILGITAFVAVVAQGVLGGLRVTEMKDQLGIFHATLAQLFFLLVCAIAMFQTDFWQRLPVREEADRHHFRFFFTVTGCLILGQLILGATMRHQHAGLAIRDFPAAYGKVWPDTDAAAVARYNQNRQEVFAYNPITAAQVVLQMVHRIVALLIFAAVALCAWRAWRWLGPRHWLTRFSAVWLGLVLAQVFLGAATIWTGKSADVATAHVACGALCLVTGGLASIVSFRLLAAPATQALRVEKNEVTSLLASSSMTAK